MLLTNTDPENRKVDHVSKVLHALPLKYSTFSLMPLAKHFENFINIHTFYRNIAKKKLAAEPRWETVKQSCKAWNSIVYYFCVIPDISWQISLKSVYPFIPKYYQNRKIHPGFKGLTTTSPNCSRLFPVSCPNFAENFLKLHSSVYP